MAHLLHWTPDPERHVVRLPYNLIIGGKHCIKAYTTEANVVYLNYDSSGNGSQFLIHKIDRAGAGEVLGIQIGIAGDINDAIDLAGKEVPA